MAERRFDIYILLPVYQWEEPAGHMLRCTVYPRTMKEYTHDFEVPAEVTRPGSMMRPSTKEAICVLGRLSLRDERVGVLETQKQRNQA